jgi:hypothetical protein
MKGGGEERNGEKGVMDDNDDGEEDEEWMDIVQIYQINQDGTRGAHWDFRTE